MGTRLYKDTGHLPALCAEFVQTRQVYTAVSASFGSRPGWRAMYTRAYLPSVVTGKLYNAEFLCCAVMPVHIRARKICAFIWADYALGGENL